MDVVHTAPERPPEVALRPPLLAGPLVGAALHVVLFALSLLLHADAEYMGVRNEALTDALTARHGDAILAQQLGLLALSASLGAGLGLIAALTLPPVIALLRPRAPLTGPRQLAWLLGLVLWSHQGLLLLSMARHPAVYAPGADQSLWIDLSLSVAVDGPPPAFTLAALLAPPALALLWWLRRLAPPLWRRVAHTPRATLLALGCSLTALGTPLLLTPARPPAAPARPNVLLVAIDSLRADNLRASPPVTPHLDALAAEGLLFERAVPTIPRTYPSWASMLTGQYPHHHGVRHMFPVPDAEGRIRVDHTLSSILKASGYRTAAFSDFAGDIFTRADFGFDHVEAPAFTLASNVALGGLKPHLHLMPWLIEVFEGATHPELLAFERLADPAWVTRRARDWIAEATEEAPDTPWFAVVFLSSGHFPFASPAPFWSRFVDPAFRGPSRFHKASFGDDLSAPERAAEAAHLRGLHAGAVAASDAAVGELAEWLEAAGLRRQLIALVTADHGECLYEHGLGTGHGDHLYGRGTLEVPLLVLAPGLAPRVEPAPVSLTDLAPTVLGRLGLAPTAPEATVAGLDLATTPPAALAQRAVFSETDLWFHPPETRRLDGRMMRFAEGLDALTEHPVSGQIHLRPELEGAAVAAKHRAILTTARKLVYIPTRDGVLLELYAPLEDPGDTRDLAREEPGTRETLAQRLYAWMLQDPGVEERLGFILPRRSAGREVTP